MYTDNTTFINNYGINGTLSFMVRYNSFIMKNSLIIINETFIEKEGSTIISEKMNNNIELSNLYVQIEVPLFFI